MTDPSGLRLVALKCEKCGSLLDADQNDVVYYCNNCDTGYELINEKDELVPAEVDFALPANVMDAEIIYYPFWVFDADVEISSRDASGTGILGDIFKKKGGGRMLQNLLKNFMYLHSILRWKISRSWVLDSPGTSQIMKLLRKIRSGDVFIPVKMLKKSLN